ncbi:hypothetical protein DFH09DRAFT_1339605 [Mycena vulgaris]|nr:hypothetical protein DFH09DRAFT_1339605 [Mycena vulgaris]
MSPIIHTTAAPSWIPPTTSTTSWKTLTDEISMFSGNETKSTSAKKHPSLPSTGILHSSAPSPTPSKDSVSSCLSSAARSPATKVESRILYAPLNPVEDDDELIVDDAQSTPPTVKSNHCQLLLHQIRQIHLWSPSARPRRTSRVFPDLIPPPEWDEVSLTIESDDDLEIFPAAGLERKVRFVVPASTPQVVEADWEEPAWSDFMVRLMLCFILPVASYRNSFSEL